MSTNKLIIKHAILISLMIGGFFFLSKLVGLEENPYLRFVNLLFVIIGIRQAIKENIYVNKETNHAKNFATGFASAALAVILSTIGVVIYIEFINPEFLEVMNQSFLIGGDTSLFELAFTLVIEGLASSIVSTLIVMQFFKNHSKEDVKS
ncbi:hypothetical protein LPB03_04325 [Polaribacter vadi]|uniref:DUF4199 domain-containing protein n=1 Tax=Polaribacter vadi TaxID=1774273 RepID=A0A1B8TXS6_9FLAO|nr:hypothetical protein [Polaribacter vadi]AOW16738.1 hypothetical protein LPB03_04325 [Polaribacter vadi]OBY64354.1 hypothetical protein LPB3_08170 [Polaribacter vadi]|tara:strand:- start:3269 stop:3718 length:450 start_codon:yes stop_codon:yes gene_type:complete